MRELAREAVSMLQQICNRSKVTPLLREIENILKIEAVFPLIEVPPKRTTATMLQLTSPLTADVRHQRDRENSKQPYDRL